MVFGLVLVPLHAHVAVDRVQALRDGAAAPDVGLLDADDLQVAAPIPGFVGGPAASHAAADDEDVGIHEHRFSACEQAHHTKPCLSLSGVSAGSAMTLSDSGSCVSYREFSY